MEQAKKWVDHVREERVGLVLAAIVITAGALLIFLANYTLSAAILGQALVAYVGVFLVAAGILYGAAILLIPS